MTDGSTNGKVVFDVQNLSKVYQMGEMEVHALREVNLMLEEGHFVVFLGPSGSGKSTLLNILGGLDIPTRGRVMYRDMNLTDTNEGTLTEYRRRNI